MPGTKEWKLDLSFYGHRPGYEKVTYDDGEEKLEPVQRYVIPPAVFQKYRMRRDTGKGLRELWLSNQQLPILPGQIGTLLNLRTLGLANNRIRELPDELFNLKRLERLILTNNNVECLPDRFRELKSMKELFLDKNNLTEFPAVICDLKRLVRISLSGNQLKSVAPGLSKLKMLSVLNLDDNCLDDASLEVVPWKDFSRNLQFLGIKGNSNVTQVPMGLMSLPQIQLVHFPGKNIHAYKVRK
mmetsp:Transcript_32551/g.51820  ORF Transcript_32551/g.51820 Transcript_32551/m.51820 type:complete len:242 (-) Transcript_32551:813-1538(-)|eukprot:CAMPEP_0203758276 /NCGR_PEP_ID=MMETSP0098-20131031/11046_1 /ASSEMBLY_ACC=CAM_ASM_000208 /TAXON_ID=96639 /ORGANISM=" , Strain NY0313808BC1" /LENGTH=241 /DNA_ID=CAMNT_0050650605 /DNA_START=223 /DNA_END=948 /DNA_ORIENTATION=+